MTGISNQGAPNPGIVSGNRFKNGNILNSTHSILWKWTSTFNYYHSGLTSDDFPFTNSPSSGVIIDGVLTDNTSPVYFTVASNSNSCTSSLMRSIKNQETSINSEQINITPVLYPNPVINLLNIENLSGNSIIFVYDSNGKKVTELNCFEEKTSLSLADFSEGIYLIMIKNYIGISTYKILKVVN